MVEELYSKNVDQQQNLYLLSHLLRVKNCAGEFAYIIKLILLTCRLVVNPLICFVTKIIPILFKVPLFLLNQAPLYVVTVMCTVLVNVMEVKVSGGRIPFRNLTSEIKMANS